MIDCRGGDPCPVCDGDWDDYPGTIIHKPHRCHVSPDSQVKWNGGNPVALCPICDKVIAYVTFEEGNTGSWRATRWYR